MQQRRSPPDLDARLAHFVDRESPLRRLEDETFSLDSAEPARILVFWGFGGQGKSLLLRRFRQSLASDPAYSHVRHALIDFTVRQEREAWRPLVWIRNELAEQGVRFPRFDVGFELYWSHFPEVRMPLLTRRWLRRASDATAAGAEEFGQLGADLSANLLADVESSVPFVGRTIGYLGRAFFDRTMKDWLIGSNASLEALFSGEHKVDLRSAAEIAYRLPILLAEDLSAFRQRESAVRYVFLIDEFERLGEQGGLPERRHTSEVEKTVKALLEQEALTGCLVAIAGREQLRWEKEPILGPRLGGDRQMRLDGLPIDDARRNLEMEGVEDLEIIEVMIASATAPEEPDDPQPVYPFLLQLQLEHLRHLRAAGKPVDAAEFVVTGDGFVAQRNALLDRLLSEYGAPLQATLRRLALCDWFDRETFQFLIRHFATGLQLDVWPVVTASSFVHASPVEGSEDVGGFEAYAMHQALRDGLVAEMDEGLQSEAREALAQHFDKRSGIGEGGNVDRQAIALLEQAVGLRVALAKQPERARDLAAWWATKADALNRPEGWHGSLQLGRVVLDALTRVLGSEHSDTLSIAFKLANCLSELGRAVEAEPLYRQVFDARTQLLGPDDPDTLISANRLAVCLLVQGRAAEAEPLLRAIVEAESSRSGIEHPNFLANLAICLADLGRAAEAEPLFRMVLKAQISRRGPEDPIALDHLGNLAVCLRKLDRAAEAEPHFVTVLQAKTRLLGADHPDVLSAAVNLALCLRNLDRADEAEPLYRQALEGRTRRLGADHPDTLDSANLLARCLQKLDRADEAEPLYVQIIEAQTRRLGGEHPETLVSADNAARFLLEIDRVFEAEALYRFTFDARARRLGDEHPETLVSAENVALCLRKLDRLSETEPLYRQILAARTNRFGSEHLKTLASADNLAACLSDLGRADEAEPLYRQTVETRTQQLGVDHPDTLDSANNLAGCLHKLDRADEAEPIYRQVLDSRISRFGSIHPLTLASAGNLADCLFDLGRAADAESQYAQILGICELHWGIEDELTRMIARKLAKCLEDQQKNVEAEEIRRDCLFEG